jgi:hypothetical protein
VTPQWIILADNTLTKRSREVGVVAHACNPYYSRGRDKRIIVQGWFKQKVIKAVSKTSWVWWFPPLIPATWEVVVGGSWSEANLRKKKIFFN